MKKLSSRKVVRYITTGGLTFVFEYSTFVLLVYGLNLSPGWGQAISYSLALIVNFTLLRGWAFKAKGTQKIGRHIAKYGLLVAINLPASTILIELLTSLGTVAFIAKAIVVATIAVWNYFVYDKIIFKQSLSSEDVI